MPLTYWPNIKLVKLSQYHTLWFFLCTFALFDYGGSKNAQGIKRELSLSQFLERARSDRWHQSGCWKYYRIWNFRHANWCPSRNRFSWPGLNNMGVYKFHFELHVNCGFSNLVTKTWLLRASACHNYGFRDFVPWIPYSVDFRTWRQPYWFVNQVVPTLTGMSVTVEFRLF